MSREIKFRAWDIEAEAFIVPFDFMVNGMGTILEKEANTIVSAYFPTTRKIILQQYTGLKDKNGKEIYEGDILEVEDSIGQRKYNRAVRFVEEGTYSGWNISLSFEPECEVIGNIHENAELLKDEEV